MVERDKKKAEEAFFSYLQENQFKMTEARRSVFQAVLATDAHFSAEDLLFQFQGNNASRASIYRTLDLLVDCGLVRKLWMRDGKAYYEHLHGHVHHEHLICVECKKIMEFDDQFFVEQLDAICSRHSFQAFCHDIKIHGLCRDCQKTS